MYSRSGYEMSSWHGLHVSLLLKKKRMTWVLNDSTKKWGWEKRFSVCERGSWKIYLTIRRWSDIDYSVTLIFNGLFKHTCITASHLVSCSAFKIFIKQDIQLNTLDNTTHFPVCLWTASSLFQEYNKSECQYLERRQWAEWALILEKTSHPSHPADNLFWLC